MHKLITTIIYAFIKRVIHFAFAFGKENIHILYRKLEKIQGMIAGPGLLPDPSLDVVR